MKKELNYLDIEGNYGGDQEWFSYFSMRMGGCGAATACEFLMYLAKERECLRDLYPYDIEHFTIEDYNRMGKRMRPYLKPRKNGIDRTSIYIEGFDAYMKMETSFPELLEMRGFEGDRDIEEAKIFIKNQINAGLPIPYLMLRHTDPKFKDFVWHWFMITGYEESEEGFFVILATYGERYVFDFHELWNTGHERRGGMVEVQLRNFAKIRCKVPE